MEDSSPEVGLQQAPVISQAGMDVQINVLSVFVSGDVLHRLVACFYLVEFVMSSNCLANSCCEYSHYLYRVLQHQTRQHVS